jgi:hypothetical protein
VSGYLFYNLGPGRSSIAVTHELQGMAVMSPRVIGLCEAIGYPLPDLEGYRLVRDTSRPGRANVAAYVRRDLDYRWHRWHDLTQTWPRTEHPGTHPPRSILELRIGPMQVIVHHQPPRTRHEDSRRGQLEGVIVLDGLMGPSWWSTSRRRPRLLLLDANRRPGVPGPGPDSLALRIGGTVHGHEIDGAVSRRFTPRRVLYRLRVPGATLHSDHPWGAFQVIP